MERNQYYEILISAEKGLFLCSRKNRSWTISGHFLEGRPSTCIASISGKYLAGTRDGVLASDDGGRSWVESSTGMDIRHVRCVARGGSANGLVFAGTEPASIYVSRDSGASWSAREEVEKMRDRLGWYLPYSPEAGCVRSFTFQGDRAYAAVEVGGILRSDDGGDDWYLIGERSGTVAPAGPGADDIHAVETHASHPDLVFAATGGGLFRSFDAGASWDNIYDCYCRAVWIDPANPEHLIFSPATRRDWYGSIARSLDGGKIWEQASDGLDVPWPGKMIVEFLQVGPELLALCSDGRLYSASADDLEWERILPEVKRASGMAKRSNNSC